MRTILFVAGLLAVGSAPVTGAAQHGAPPAPPAHAAPSTHAATAAKAAAKPAAQPVEKSPASTHEKASEKAPDKAATARKGAPFSDLEAAFNRIAQKIDGAEVMPGGLRISSGSPAAPAPAHAAEGRPAEARAARGEATPRLHLTWRSPVVWPATLGPAEAHDTDPAHETSRIALAWP